MNGLPGTAPGKLSDTSMWAIVLSNLLTLVLAYVQHWPVGLVLWIYWAQSVIIGMTNVVRMLRLREFSTKGMKMNGQPVPETPASKRQLAVFFTIHYGFFHLIYAVFLFAENPLHELPEIDRIWLAIAIIGFAASHFFSLFYNSGEDFKARKPNLGTLMFYPYLRIIPMHLTIIFGSMMGYEKILLFMFLKTLSDVGMHMVEHALFRKGGETTDDYIRSISAKRRQ